MRETMNKLKKLTRKKALNPYSYEGRKAETDRLMALYKAAIRKARKEAAKKA